MAYVTGSLVIDAPAAALNNRGRDVGAKTDNSVAVKRLKAPDGSQYPYVSAQAFRYWVRTHLQLSDPNWKASPVFKENENLAFSDGNPVEWWDDDLFGYMRAPESDEGRKWGTPLAKPTAKGKKDKKPVITRVSPFRVSTFVALAPNGITDDFCTMMRHDEGDPVLFEHQFYSAHLRGLFSLDLTSAGTFYNAERVGLHNLDANRVPGAQEKCGDEIVVRKQKAFRLPLSERQIRVSSLIRSLGALTGGAKQALHYTDLTPAVVFAAVTKGGNHPFHRVIGANKSHQTVLHLEALTEILNVYQDEFLSPIVIGWAQGFLDDERKKLIEFIEQRRAEKKEPRIAEVTHPKAALESLAAQLQDAANGAWYE